MAYNDIKLKEDVVRFLQYCDKSGVKPRRDNYNKWQRLGDDITEGASASAQTVQKHLGPWKQLVEVLSDPAVQRTLIYTPE